MKMKGPMGAIVFLQHICFFFLEAKKGRKHHGHDTGINHPLNQYVDPWLVDQWALIIS